jgi:hypothetical protein
VAEGQTSTAKSLPDHGLVFGRTGPPRPSLSRQAAYRIEIQVGRIFLDARASIDADTGGLVVQLERMVGSDGETALEHHDDIIEALRA